MTKTQERAAARRMVVADLESQVKRRREIVAGWRVGTVGDAYRREIARLWRVALRAVKAQG